MADREATILEFGAGRPTARAGALRPTGYNVTAHECGDNVSEHHDP